MPAFGFSVGDAIATIELIRKLVGGLKSTTGSAAQYQRTIIELESLQRVLRSVETLAADEDENSSRIDNLRAAAFATSLTLRDFLLKLSKYEASLAPAGGMNKIKRGAKAARWIMSMDEEVNRLQLYVAGQMLSINTQFRLLERESTKESETRRRAEHKEVIGAINDQNNAINLVNRSVLPIDKKVQEYKQSVDSIARDSILNTNILVELQQRIIQNPSTPLRDSIKLKDALGRSFALPYAYFNQWEVLESFIRQIFCAKDIPGTHQVQNGNFFISPSTCESKALTKANWPSNVYPGAGLTMTIILGMLTMTVRQCPRPSCGFQFPDATDTGMFVTCHACGLQFCFNPDIKHLGLKDEDEKLQIIHQREDSSSFGRRYVPKDVIDFQHKDEITYEVTSLSAAYSPMPEIEPKRSEAQKLTSDNLTALEILSSKEIISSQVKLVSRDSPQLPSIDWNNGTSGMTAWLNSSAAPAHEGEHLGLKSDAFQAETEQLQQEWKDIECLTRVHFVSTVSESQPLRDIVNEYQAMPLDAQVYVRKIVDRFPTLPSYLAKRFANANARRLSRLQQRKESDVNEVNPPTSLGSKSPNTNGHSAKPRLTTDCNRVGASVESPNYQKVLFNSNPNLRNGENQIVRTINKTKEFVESRPNPSSEALKTSTNNLTTAGKLPRQTQLKCYQCKFYSNSYRTKQELQQHIALAHGKKKRKVFTCVDESPDQKMLANCADCRDSKIYNAYHEAIAHLRRTHLSLWTTELKSKSGKIRSHQMNIPMHIHIKKIELDTVGNDVGAATSMLGPLT